MNRVVFSSNKYTVTRNITEFISDVFGAKIAWNSFSSDEELDALFIVNGCPVFSSGEVFDNLGHAMLKAKRLIWIQNDYRIGGLSETSYAESPYRAAFRKRIEQGKRPAERWTTIKRAGHTYVNWNLLGWRFGHYCVPPSDRKFKDQMVYYGNLRKYRTNYFDEFFYQPTIKTTILAPNYKFYNLYLSEKITHKIIQVPDLYNFIGEFGLGLYLEDTKSHAEFHSPANRFYEMLSTGVPMVFQCESAHMMKQSGYEISPDMLAIPKTLPYRLEKQNDIFEAQRDQWYNRVYFERCDLGNHLRDLWNS